MTSPVPDDELIERLKDGDDLRTRIEAASRITELIAALERIAAMTDIEADFDGFEAREIARAALSTQGEQSDANTNA